MDRDEWNIEDEIELANEYIKNIQSSINFIGKKFKELEEKMKEIRQLMEDDRK